MHGVARHARLGVSLGFAITVMLSADLTAQTSAPQAGKTIAEADCAATRLGTGIPASAIGVPVRL